MKFNLSIDGRLHKQIFTVEEIANIEEDVKNLHGKTLNKIKLSCSICREKKLDKIYEVICYEFITNKHALFVANRPQSIAYAGSLIYCNNCNKSTNFSSY